MSTLLNSMAVARRSDAEAAELLQAYISTGPAMTMSHSPELAKTQAPKGAAGAIDPTI